MPRSRGRSSIGAQASMPCTVPGLSLGSRSNRPGRVRNSANRRGSATTAARVPASARCGRKRANWRVSPSPCSLITSSRAGGGPAVQRVTGRTSPSGARPVTRGGSFISLNARQASSQRRRQNRARARCPAASRWSGCRDSTKLYRAMAVSNRPSACSRWARRKSPSSCRADGTAAAGTCTGATKSTVAAGTVRARAP